MNQLFKAASEAVSASKQAARQAKEASDVVLMQAIKVLLASGVSIRETASMLDSSKATVGRLAALPSTATPIFSTDGEFTDLVVSNGWGSQKRLDEVYEWCLIYDGEHGIELPPAVLNLTKDQALKNLQDAYEQERLAGESRLTDDERNAVRRRCRLASVIARAHGASDDELARSQD